MSRKKQQRAHVIVKNLKKLRKELARRRYDYVASQVVEKLDKCLYEEYEIPHDD